MFILIRMTNYDNDRTVAFLGKFDTADEARIAMARGAILAKDEYLDMGYDEDEVECEIKEWTTVVYPDNNELDATHYFIFDDNDTVTPWVYPAF